jgi:hypothetical protein
MENVFIARQRTVYQECVRKNVLSGSFPGTPINDPLLRSGRFRVFIRCRQTARETMGVRAATVRADRLPLDSMWVKCQERCPTNRSVNVKVKDTCMWKKLNYLLDKWKGRQGNDELNTPYSRLRMRLKTRTAKPQT